MSYSYHNFPWCEILLIAVDTWYEAALLHMLAGGELWALAQITCSSYSAPTAKT